MVYLHYESKFEIVSMDMNSRCFKTWESININSYKNNSINSFQVLIDKPILTKPVVQSTNDISNPS